MSEPLTPWEKDWCVSSRRAEAVLLDEASMLLNEMLAMHAAVPRASYQGCDENPCKWCVRARKLVIQIENSTP